MADTRELILEAAWDLFAERGFEDVSVRDVTSAAGVNLASVSYHFGGKDGLIQETVKRCLNPLYEYGIKLLKDAEIEYGGLENIPFKHLMMCWIRPTLLPEECGVRFDLILRLIARYLIEVNYAVPLISQRLLGESFDGYIKAFSVHCPDYTSEQIVRQLIFIEGAAFYSGGIGPTIMQHISGKKVDISVADREAILNDVVHCSLFGFRGKEDGCCMQSVTT